MTTPLSSDSAKWRDDSLPVFTFTLPFSLFSPTLSDAVLENDDASAEFDVTGCDDDVVRLDSDAENALRMPLELAEVTSLLALLLLLLLRSSSATTRQASMCNACSQEERVWWESAARDKLRQ
jgi:hypothetical protein